MVPEFVFFWQDWEPETGVFCQWYPSSIIDGQYQYNCCEQYMMAAKARLFQVSPLISSFIAIFTPSAAGR